MTYVGKIEDVAYVCRASQEQAQFEIEFYEDALNRMGLLLDVLRKSGASPYEHQHKANLAMLQEIAACASRLIEMSRDG